MRTVDDQLDRSLFNERLLAMLASAFAGARGGARGGRRLRHMSFVVSHRTREIGIRVALGASRGSAMWLIIRDAATMLCAGVLIAVPAVWMLGRLVESQLFGIRAMDWPTISVAAVLVAVATLAASALPVGRATAISPMEAFAATNRLMRASRLCDRPVARTLLSVTERRLVSKPTDLVQGTLDLLILKIIALEPMHGWAIAQRIHQMSGEVLQVGQSALYPSLHKLEQNGWISSEWAVSENNRRAKYYTFTKAGRKALEKEAAQWERLAAAISLIVRTV